MTVLVIALLLSMGWVASASSAEAEKTIYYVQLVRGNDASQPPEPNALKIGSRLDKHLRAVYRWKHYWEVQCVELPVEDGATGRATVRGEHEIEVDLRIRSKRKVLFRRNGKMVCTWTGPRGRQFTIQGTSFGDDEAWFIVVRRDKPLR